VIIILALATLLVAAIAFFFGSSLSSKIRNLTDMADRISVGELDVDLTVKSKDEIGALAEAINRMQDSIRISIDRLRRRGR
jgi:methyl-accepting chemotaxis protein